MNWFSTDLAEQYLQHELVLNRPCRTVLTASIYVYLRTPTCCLSCCNRSEHRSHKLHDGEEGLLNTQQERVSYVPSTETTQILRNTEDHSSNSESQNRLSEASPTELRPQARTTTSRSCTIRPAVDEPGTATKARKRISPTPASHKLCSRSSYFGRDYLDAITRIWLQRLCHTHVSLLPSICCFQFPCQCVLHGTAPTTI